MKRICSICARGGSKGVINKNIRTIAGKPLIAHSIERAKESKSFESIVVSSDSEEILDTARNFGADFVIKRPLNLASDKSAKLPAIQHCISSIEKELNKTFDTIVDLDATSPLRSVKDIIESIAMLEQSQSSNLITGSHSRRSPYFNLVELNEDKYVRRSKELDKAVVRRQDAPECFDMNASIYIWKREGFFDHSRVLLDNTILFSMPEERSIDIDSELDFEIVKYLLEKDK
jgi:N-acylneuraminate cytidylyltransferase/CMP-N,N'-diacetyllegionaminic acid synthase